MECFEVFHADISAKKRKRVITKVNGGWNTPRTAYGRIAMHCDGAHRGVHRYQIKVLRMKGSNANITIGIDQCRENKNFDFSRCVGHNLHYALSAWGSQWDPSGNVSPCDVTFQRGDTVWMEVDVRRRTLSFAVNQSAMMTLFRIQSSSTPFYFAVVLKNKGDSIKLVDHSFIPGSSASTRCDVDERTQVKTIVDAQVDSLEDMVRKLRSQLQEEKRNNAATVNRNEQLQKEMQELREETEFRMTSLAELVQVEATSLNKAGSKVSRLQRENDKLKVIQKKYEEELQRLEQEKHELVVKHRKAASELKEVREWNEAMKNQLSSFQRMATFVLHHSESSPQRK